MGLQSGEDEHKKASVKKKNIEGLVDRHHSSINRGMLSEKKGGDNPVLFCTDRILVHIPFRAFYTGSHIG